MLQKGATHSSDLSLSCAYSLFLIKVYLKASVISYDFVHLLCSGNKNKIYINIQPNKELKNIHNKGSIAS